VGAHVPAVGEQRYRLGDAAGGDFNHHHHQRNRDDDLRASLAITGHALWVAVHRVVAVRAGYNGGAARYYWLARKSRMRPSSSGGATGGATPMRRSRPAISGETMV